jgi:hypothetical protein
VYHTRDQHYSFVESGQPQELMEKGHLTKQDIIEAVLDVIWM